MRINPSSSLSSLPFWFYPVLNILLYNSSYHHSEEAPIKTLYFSIILIILFNGCESQSEHDARIAKEARAALLAELKNQQQAEARAKEAREQNSTLFRIGISQEGEKITIDINKTQHFFKNLSKKITKQMDQFSREMEKGIEIDEHHITIDINKTGNFLDKWHQKMQNFANEIDALSKSLEHNKTEDQEYKE
jgi:uncharacterized protein (UPF0333 family)